MILSRVWTARETSHIPMEEAVSAVGFAFPREAEGGGGGTDGDGWEARPA